MTLSKLDTYILNYFKELQNNKTLKGINNVDIIVERSYRTNTLYVKFVLLLGKSAYKRTLRFGDHGPSVRHSGVRGVVIPNPNDIKKSLLRKIKYLVYNEVKILLLKAPRHLIYNFKT